MTDTFQRIYAGNLWHGTETRSGPGSSAAATAPMAAWLVQTVERMGLRSVLDVGCGEGLWMPDLPGYIGVDVVDGAIATARHAHPDRTYYVADVTEVPLPHCDLVFTRDFMQHLSVADGLRVLEHMDASWLIASTYVGGTNEDPVSPWHAYNVDLSVSPFLMGEPLELVADGYNEAGELVDTAKHVGLWRL